MITMRRDSAGWLTATVAMITILLCACSGGATTTNAEPQEPTTKPSGDAQPARLDQLAEGTALAPGAYALSARAQPDMTLAVIDIPEGFEG
jgi:hypothetical protein